MFLLPIVTDKPIVLLDAVERVIMVLSIPAPIRRSDLLVIVTDVVHVLEPEGTMTVSPSAALLIAVWTSRLEADAALIVAA